MCSSARGSRACKILCKAGRRIAAEVGVVRKGVGTAEEARKEIEDAIEVEINPEFVIALAGHVRHVVDQLYPLDRGFTRAEVVAAEVEVTCPGINHSFRLI